MTDTIPPLNAPLLKGEEIKALNAQIGHQVASFDPTDNLYRRALEHEEKYKFS